MSLYFFMSRKSGYCLCWKQGWKIYEPGEAFVPAKETIEEIRRKYQIYSNQIGVFHTCIPLSVRAAEISAEGSSIYQYDPKGKAANAYRTLTEEVMDRG